jgi:SAM-dependent methyltransferase
MRAQRYARDRDGLAAVCSYGMPEFYNRAIHFCQWLALRRWLRAAPLTPVLDVGCGVGRWSRMLAAQGACVVGVDLSTTMVEEARRRAKDAGLARSCRFVAGDLATLDLDERYALIVGVTVLQHILDEGALERAVENLARHLAPGGRMVLLEAAPTRRVKRCDTAIFTARGEDTYRAAFARAGLVVREMTGVDPAPMKTWLLPHYRNLPPVARLFALALVVATSLPIDALFGRLLARASWHKVFVLEHAESHLA